MVKLVSGFFLGVCVTVVAGLVLGHFYPRLALDPYSLGRFHEDVEIGYKIPDALGRDVDPNEPIEPFLPGKDRGVVIVTRHGVKTLRLCCDGSEPKPTP
jgi:hypothetical protein